MKEIFGILLNNNIVGFEGFSDHYMMTAVCHMILSVEVKMYLIYKRNVTWPLISNTKLFKETSDIMEIVLVLSVMSY